MREPAIFSRRAAAAIPLAALAGAASATMPAPAAAGSDAALLELGAQWEALLLEFESLNDRFHAVSDVEFAELSSEFDAEGKRLSRREDSLFSAIFSMPATTTAGLATKARMLVRELQINGDADVTPGDLQSVERAAAGADGMLDKATWGLLADIIRLAQKERAS